MHVREKITHQFSRSLSHAAKPCLHGNGESWSAHVNESTRDSVIHHVSIARKKQYHL